MITLPLGFILTLAIMIYSMGGNLAIFFNPHALLITCGGTVTILLFANPTTVLKNLFRQTAGLFKKTKKFSDVRDELMALSKNKQLSSFSADEFVAYAQELWKQGVTPELFVVMISQKKLEIEQRSVDAIQSLKNLAKYPPALGMAGTVIGVVSLFQTLDQNKEHVGASLALAMTATFFGLAVANAFVMPVADRLQIKHINQKQYMQSVYQILLLINQNEPGDFIADEVELRGA